MPGANHHATWHARLHYLGPRSLPPHRPPCKVGLIPNDCIAEVRSQRLPLSPRCHDAHQRQDGMTVHSCARAYSRHVTAEKNDPSHRCLMATSRVPSLLARVGAGGRGSAHVQLALRTCSWARRLLPA
eukprot:scaffold50131_cov27-Tisochrysis_lutea.AAC.2